MSFSQLDAPFELRLAETPAPFSSWHTVCSLARPQARGPRREADRFALRVKTELAESNTTDLLVKNGKALRQAHQYLALTKALQHALDDRLISYGPCDGVRLPKAHNEDGFKSIFLIAAQVESLADLLDSQQPYGLLVRFAAYTDLRAGELTGLRIRDLNLKAGHAEVRQTLQHIAGEWVVGTPESACSTRNVQLASRALVADLPEYLMPHPRSGDPDASGWPGRNPGSHAVTYERVFDVASFRRNYLKPALCSLKMDDGMRSHDLRHTFASLMLAAQFPPYEVSRWIGHANLATTHTPSTPTCIRAITRLTWTASTRSSRLEISPRRLPVRTS